jgi:ATP-dependent Clp protease ATP-binding subunit ClpA
MRPRLTPDVEEALHVAEYEAHAGGQAYVGDGHLLFGLAAGHSGVAAEALAAAGVTTGEVRNRLRRIVARDTDGLRGRLPWTPRLTNVIGAAASAASGPVESSRLLAVLLDEDEGVAAAILEDMACADAVRTELNRIEASGAS